MFETKLLKLKKRNSWEKNRSKNRNPSISDNLELILENYSQNKRFKFVRETGNLTLTPKMFTNLTNFSVFYKFINKNLVNKNLEININSVDLILVNKSFSEKSKQKFKNFMDFSLYYKNKLFTNFLECILYKFAFHYNFQEQDRNQNETLIKLVKSKNSKETKQLTYSSTQTESSIIVSRQLDDFSFANFFQSFVSQTYLKKKRKEKDFFFNSETINSSIDVSLNSYYFETWKETSYSNFSGQRLQLALNVENFKFETLLSLFYLYKKLKLPIHFKQNSFENSLNSVNSDSGSSKPLLLKISKKNKFNFYRLKQLFYKFYYFYFLIFSLNNCPLNFHQFSLESFFKNRNFFQLASLEKFKTKFKFPNFIKNSEITSLALKQNSITNNLLKTNFLFVEKIFKNNVSVFVKFIYYNVASFQDVSILFKNKALYFMKEFSTAYRNFKIFTKVNTFNSNLASVLNNLNYSNIEKFIFEILQKVTLKNEKNVPISEINKNFVFYFSPLNQEIYFVSSWRNLDKYFLLFEFFYIWIEKTYFLNLKNFSSVYFNLLLISNSFFFSNWTNQSVLNYKHVYHLSCLKDCLVSKNSTYSFLKLNSANTKLNQIQKFTYTKKIKQMVKIYSSQTQENLISNLTPYILSWTYLFRFKLEKKDWHELDKILSQLIWRWACRRHNNKSKKWIQSKYFFSLNKELWFFGQIVPTSFVETITTTNNLNFIYLPSHGQVFHYLNSSEKFLDEFK